MSVGYAINATVSGSVWTPTAKKSAAGSLSLATGTAVTIPWIANTHSGSADTTTADLKLAIMAAMAAIVNDLAANGEPT